MRICPDDWHPMIRFIIGKQAIGAWPNGARVRKLTADPGDGHEPGALGTVRGSIGPVEAPGYPMAFVYLLEWDDLPGLPVLCAELNIRGEMRLGLDEAPPS